MKSLFAAVALLTVIARAQQPAVTPPVTPGASSEDLRNLPRSPPWKPGDPVREMPDLRRSDGTPVRVTGRSHVLTIANATVAIHDLRGNVRAEAFTLQSLWRDGRCSTAAADPVTALYDGRADRWLLARWAAPFTYCIAVSRRADPVTGGWHLYEFRLPMYRAGSTLELAAGTYSLPIDLGGARVLFAFDRTRMLEGAPAAYTRTLPAHKAVPRNE